MLESRVLLPGPPPDIREFVKKYRDYTLPVKLWHTVVKVDME
jgi:hypothetical protein